jgi:RimJ/RimL family protein N-acetyltransferase
VRPESFRPPLELRGTHVALVPLDPSHRDALFRAARDPEVTRFLTVAPGRSPEAARDLIALLLERQATGTDLPFTTVKLPEEQPIGMTRFLHIDRENNSVEIGGTWLDSAFWRTPVNTEAKLLMFRHAFDVEGAHRVWLQTDLRNERSQRAIVRLGAIREGVLREDRLLPTGRYRTSVVYGVLADEWPRVRSRLEQRLADRSP